MDSSLIIPLLNYLTNFNGGVFVEESFLSIVVPTHNNEKTLERCLNSILNQEYSNYEVVLVDDGSTDLTSSICQRFSQQYARIKYYKRENQGVSATRNFAVEHAVGDFIMFVDGDDYVTKTFCSDAINNQRQYNSDIVEFGYTRLLAKDNYNVFFAFNTLNGLITKEQMMSKLMIDSYLWNKLYRKSLFDNIRFPIGQSYEDSAIIYKLIDKAQQLSFIRKSNYVYAYSQGSITTNYASSNIRDQFKSATSLMGFLQDKYPVAYNSNRVNLMRVAVRYLTYCNDDYDVELTNKADQILRKIVNISEISLKYKVIVMMYRVWPALLKRIIRTKRVQINTN